MSAITEGLVGYWPLVADTDDHAETGHRTHAQDVELGHRGPRGVAAARFNGTTSVLETADHPSLHFGDGDFTLVAWVEPDAARGDVVGDLLSKFDPVHRRGFGLSIVTNTGVTSTAQANYRNLHFGVDAARVDPSWTDCGRPGNAAFVTALAVHDGLLYAGTCELGAGERGRLWRYDGGQTWVDLGNPVGCNAIPSVASYDGRLFCGTGRYNTNGSALGDPRNRTPGGQVYRVTPDGAWTACGHPGAEGATPEANDVPGYYTGKADEVVALTVYRGDLYCLSYHRPGVFVYRGDETWECLGLDDRYILSLTVYRDRLYALIDGGPVYRYDGGSEWTDCGHPAGSEQTYAGVTAGGELFVSTWPEAEVFRYGGDRSWQRVGRVGYEREVMGMALYNGKVYVGSLPMANVWRMDGDVFSYLGTLDHSPAPLRRAWSMTVHDGRLVVGTLPGGRVCAIEAGKMATWDQAFPAGWHHVTAIKERGRLSLYVDGRLVARSTAFYPGDYDVTTDRPLTIGRGPYEHFAGAMSGVRLYGRALTEREIAQLAEAE